MGKYDEAIYRYLSEEERFADLFNAGCFRGRQLVDAKELERLAGRIQISEMYERKRKGKRNPLHKSIYRDIRMKLSDGTRFIILAVENQQAVDYEMPWRIMRYDCAEYENQIENIHKGKAEQRKHGKKKTNSQGDSRHRGISTKMDESDRLNPVFTICFYHGTEAWNGPKSLKDMMDFGGKDVGWQELFADYRMIFVDAGDLELAANCRTDLKLLLDFLRMRKDKERMLALLQGEAYANVAKDMAETIAVMADMPEILENVEKYKNEEGGGYSMCVAIEGIREDARALGVSQGINQGISVGISQGIKIIAMIKSSRAEGKEDGDIKQTVIEEFKLTPEEADGFMVI